MSKVDFLNPLRKVVCHVKIFSLILPYILRISCKINTSGVFLVYSDAIGFIHVQSVTELSICKLKFSSS